MQIIMTLKYHQQNLKCDSNYLLANKCGLCCKHVFMDFSEESVSKATSSWPSKNTLSKALDMSNGCF